MPVYNAITGAGLNTENLVDQLQQGQLTFAFNALISNWEGNTVTYQQEASTYKSITFDNNYVPVGVFAIPSIDRVVYFLTDNNGGSQIAYTDHEENSYTVLLDDSCLNFSIDYPIHQIVIKSTNCSTEIYWTDAHNVRRYLNFDDLPWVEVPNPNDDYNPIKLVGQVDCNKLAVQPNFSIPEAQVIDVVEGGVVPEGSYQFVVQYSNALGEGYSSFYNASNPVSIHDAHRSGENFNLPTSKAIKLRVKGLDTTGLFDYFNLVVIQNVNQISTPKLVGTYPISNQEYDIIYTGQVSENINITQEQIFQKYQYYDIAKGVTASDDRLIWYNLTEQQHINYQEVWKNIPVYWQTTRLEADAYADAMNTYNYKSYMRDEVYPLCGVFVLANGKETDRFPLVNREGTPEELLNDFWKTHNTATVEQTFADGTQLGKFGFWESEIPYPNSIPIWGDLSNKKQRHFLFPDEAISPRFKNIDGTDYIFPIGIRIFKQDVLSAINSYLTDEQKRQIVGFKIVRGDRSVGNNSIVAKGHFTNVGTYNYESQDYLFANYPYNDIGDDPLFATKKVKPLSGFDPTHVSKPFNNKDTFQYLAFHSPDTHFKQPFGIDSGIVKIEAIDYGEASLHFVPIDDNAQYKFATQNVFKLSVALAAAVAFDYSRSGTPSFNASDALSVFSSNQELLEKLITYRNFGYNITSIANFNQTIPVKNYQFNIEEGKYINSQFNSLDKKIVNNWSRESSVMLKLDDKIRPATSFSPSIPVDNSRITASESLSVTQITPEEFFNLLQTSQDINVLIALIMGIQYACNDISSSQNQNYVLMPLISRLLQAYTGTANLSGLLALENSSDFCGTFDTLPYVTIAADDPTNPTSNVNQYVSISNIHGYTIDSVAQVHNDYPTGFTANTVINLNYFYDEFEASDALVSDTEGDIDPPSGTPETEVNQMIADHIAANNVQDVFQVCGGAVMTATYKSLLYATNLYSTININTSSDNNLSALRTRDVNAYYGSIKRYLPGQWGQINSFSVVDTGFFGRLTDEEYPIIYGGDTYINKFAFKTKVPIFRKKTVGLPDQSDIALDEEGNLGYPMYYISTKPVSDELVIDEDALSTAYAGIGLVNKTKIAGSVLQTIGGVLIAAGLATSVTVVGSIAGIIITAVGAVLSVVGALLKNVRSKIEKAAIKLYRDLFQQIIDTLGLKNINLDLSSTTGISNTGIFYQYVYGIPNYYVESQINVDMRNATNDEAGNYYPRVGDNIPDSWLQEARIPIINDNVYSYNDSYSKQNKENFYSTLREDFDYNKVCLREFPNRAIWADRTSLNETINNWLIYRPVNRYDFTKEFGQITSLTGILNRQVLARFENKTQIYNALTTVDTTGQRAYIGDDRLFSSAPPIDILDVDGGSMGSQNQFLLKTEFGIFYTDVKRGQVILLVGDKPQNLANKDMTRWFKNNLPFQISKDIEGFYTDNHYKNVGIHGIYDETYNRVILTKKDYSVKKEFKLYLNEGIIFDLKEKNDILAKYQAQGWTFSGQTGKYLNFLKGSDTEQVQLIPIELGDIKYFQDISWTISYSFITQRWVSWHAYKPNCYIPGLDKFKAVLGSNVHTHNDRIDSFCEFYGLQYPYILEYPISYQYKTEVLQYISDSSTAFRFSDKYMSYEPDDILYFNKAFIYNGNQCSGLLNLIPRLSGNMASYLTYPKYNSDSKDILLSKKNGNYFFNTFWDIVKNKNSTFFENDKLGMHRTLLNENLDYSQRNFKKDKILSKDVKIRLILDKPHDYLITSHIFTANTQESAL